MGASITNQNFFNFMAFFRKCTKYIGFAPPSKGLCLLLRPVMDPPLFLLFFVTTLLKLDQLNEQEVDLK